MRDTLIMYRRQSSFTEATFLDIEIKEKIHQLGGIFGFDEDNSMDESLRKTVLMWIKNSAAEQILSSRKGVSEAAKIVRNCCFICLVINM